MKLLQMKDLIKKKKKYESTENIIENTESKNYS